MQLKTPVDFSTLAPFIEPDVQIDKQTLIHRCAGKVSYAMLTILKLMVFHRACKDQNGKVYLA